MGFDPTLIQVCTFDFTHLCSWPTLLMSLVRFIHLKTKHQSFANMYHQQYTNTCIILERKITKKLPVRKHFQVGTFYKMKKEYNLRAKFFFTSIKAVAQSRQQSNECLLTINAAVARKFNNYLLEMKQCVYPQRGKKPFL